MAEKASAPRPISRTCTERSITRRASEIGLRVRVTPAAAPASSVAPSMIAASSSTLPSAVKTAPRPALNSGSSSSTRTAVSTASIAGPPPDSTVAPASAARASAAR